MNLNNKYILIRSTVNNIFRQCSLQYLAEPSWLIERIAHYICNNLNSSDLIKSCISFSPYGLRNKIVHYSTRNMFIRRDGFRKPHVTNKSVLTWYHITPGDKAVKLLPEASRYLNYIHTSSIKTKDQLINSGVPEEKLVVIPLGVDTSIFRPASMEEKKRIRKKIGVPQDAICIGSFQKDGVGWDDGLEPKLIKGPDILCDVIQVLASKYPIHVLLTGPAREYVKKRLREANIPCFHNYFDNYSDIVPFYQALDFYLITSRVEGGPESILESMACGIPVVTTDVGLAADVVDSDKIGKIAFSNTIDEIVALCESTIDEGRKHSDYKVENARQYDWSEIAKQHYDNIYKNLI